MTGSLGGLSGQNEIIGGNQPSGHFRDLAHLIGARNALAIDPFAHTGLGHIANDGGKIGGRDLAIRKVGRKLHVESVTQNGEHLQPQFGERQASALSPIIPGMGNMLKSLREERGWTHERAAEAMGVSRSQFIKLERGERRLNADYIGLAAKAFGVAPSRILADEDKLTIPIVGRVGATPDGAVLQANGDGHLGELEVPAGATGDEAALEVDGYSMGIYAPDGSVILYHDRRDPPTEDMLGEVCVVGLPDGRVLMKRLLRGSQRGLFESIVGETIRDQQIEWAGVVSIVIHPRHAKRLRVS